MKNITLVVTVLLFISCKKETFAQTTDSTAVFSSAISIDTTTIKHYKSKLLSDFYDSKNNQTIWNFIEKRKSALNFLASAEKNGLNPDDYFSGILEIKEKYINQLSEKELIEYDLMITHGLQKYISDVSKGKLNPKYIYRDWDLKPKEIDVNSVLISAYDTNNFSGEIAAVEPKSETYLQLKKALEIIDALPEDFSRPIDISKKIKPLETNSKIIAIKKRLMFWEDLVKKDTLTKVYDKEAVKAMKNFQQRHGLFPDGVIGMGTINALNLNKSVRREIIIANLERWRWFPEAFGDHFTLVNIPEYTLRIIKDKDTLQTYRVVVGTMKRKSPILTSKLKSVVINPTWTVPPTIIKEDLVPDATKNRNYFARQNIVIYNYKNEKVNPYQWDPEKANNYRYVQDPGSHNSLGNMKILFPNKFSVYLHDTNHRDGFSRNFRSLSSGCTRVENPLKLAQYVLNDTVNFNDEKLAKLIETKKTVTYNIKQNIQHFQLYWTAWSKKNRLIFRDDIYGLDADLYCRLRHQGR